MSAQPVAVDILNDDIAVDIATTTFADIPDHAPDDLQEAPPEEREP